MEQKDIDIYEILKDEEYGTELYTPICGKVWHSGMANDKDSAKAIWTEDKDGREHFFDKNGKIYKEGEVLLFPSNEMRDWSKFFKKGDVLVHRDCDIHVIFEGFKDNRYTRFKSKHYLWKECFEDYNKEVSEMITFTFRKASDDEAHAYINTLEKHFGGKLNRETLEIEKQLEFKDGDIVVAEEDNYYDKVIFIAAIKDDIVSKVLINVRYEDYEVHYNEYRFGHNRSLRLATDSEKQQLFDALAKEGKRWNSEKKQIVDLKPAFEIGKLYVFDEEDEDGKVTVIGKLIGKEEGELTIGNQYEIENEKFVTDEVFFLNISLHKELREATEGEILMFQKACTLWEKEKQAKEQPAFKPFDKVLVRCNKKYKWLPAFFVRDRGDEYAWRYKVLCIHSGKTADFAYCIPFEGHENIACTSYDIENLPF